MSAVFCWTPVYSVNIAEIDEEHRRIFRIIHDLDYAIAAGRGEIVVEDILRRVVEYTIQHFATEEQLMEQHGFPGFAAHRFEHNALTQRITSSQLEHEAGNPEAAASLAHFLQHWLKQHILQTDKQYSEFLNAKGVV